jgi:hypothetical protein
MEAPIESGRNLFTYEHDARRWELLVRIVYSILIGIVMWIYGVITGLCTFVQFFVILILGRRSRGLSEFVKGYLEYHVHVLSSTSLMTDTRPGILPRPVKIFERDQPPAP